MISTFAKKGLVLGMLALVAACGGGDKPAEEAAAGPATTDAAQNTNQGSGDAATQAPATPGAGAPTAGGTVHTVQMVTTNGGASGEFVPANLTVKQGDVIRYVQQTTGAVHNVSFPADRNPGKSGLPPESPYLQTEGQTYDLPVSMGAGEYNYVCVPHAPMGMTGKITVQ